MENKRSFPTWVIVVYCSVILAIIFTGIAYYIMEKRNIQRQVESELMVIAELKTDQITKWIDERLNSVRIFTESPYFNETVINWLHYQQQKDYDYISQRINTLFEYFPEDGVLLVDKKMNVRFALHETTYTLVALVKEIQETVSRSWNNNEAVLTPIYICEVSPKPHIGAVSPIFYPDNNEPAGAIIFLSKASTFLYPLIESRPVPWETSETLLIRRDNDEVLFLNELRHEKNTALQFRVSLSETNIPAVRAILGDEGVFYGTDYRNESVISVLKPIPDTNWFLVTKRDEAEAFSKWYQRSVTIFVFIILLIIGTTLMAAWVWQRKENEFYKKLLLAEKNLKEKEHRYRTLAESAQTLIWASGTDNKYEYFNTKFQDFIGSSDEEIHEKGWLKRIHPSDLDKYLRTFSQSFDNHTPYTITYRIKRYDGKYRWLLEEGKPRYDRGGIFLGYIGSCLDITELIEKSNEVKNINTILEKRIEERTQELTIVNKELENFAYSVSHDLRSPLRAINGFSKILQDEIKNNSAKENTRLINIIRDNAMKMDTLISDLLELSRTARVDLRLSTINMTQLAKAVFSEVTANDSDLKVDFSIEKLPSAYGDVRLIKQLLINLIGNACKFSRTREHPEIKIGYFTENEVQIYYVKDNGVGFDDRFEHKLFDLFQRLHDTDEFEGTGVGLAIVKQIVSKHKGKVWAVSQINQGSTFFFSLPNVKNQSL